jgi:hypothetical protein
VRFGVLAVCAVLLAACKPTVRAAGLTYDVGFRKTWGDGQAEVAGYSLTYPRYGQPRTGTAVTIFVTEPLSESLRVKADPGKEWCGNLSTQLLFDPRQIRATQQHAVDGPTDGLAEDAVLLWARVMTGRRLAAGESREVRGSRSALKWTQAKVSRSAVDSDAMGRFVVDVYEIEAGPAVRSCAAPGGPVGIVGRGEGGVVGCGS